MDSSLMEGKRSRCPPGSPPDAPAANVVVANPLRRRKKPEKVGDAGG
jgi:hypothetical protein